MQKATYGVEVFTTREVHVGKGGDTIRDHDKSGTPLSVLVNEFLRARGVIPVFVTPPWFTLVSRFRSKKNPDAPETAVYRVAMSLIYCHQEAVYDESREPDSFEETQNEDAEKVKVREVDPGQIKTVRHKAVLPRDILEQSNGPVIPIPVRHRGEGR